MYIKSQFKPFKYTVSEHVTHLFFLFNNSTRDILKTSTCIWTNYQNYLITLNITFKTASEMLTFPNINSNYYFFLKGNWWLNPDLSRVCDAHENLHRLEKSSLQHEAQALKTKPNVHSLSLWPKLQHVQPRCRSALALIDRTKSSPTIFKSQTWAVERTLCICAVL